MIDEKNLGVALRELAGPDETGPAPIESLLRRGRHARFARMARTGGIAAAAFALVAGLAAVARPGEPGPVPLELAGQTTRRTTFHFEQTFTLKLSDGIVLGGGEPYRGAYDPVHDRGYVTRVWVGQPLQIEEQRQIGDACYSHHGDRTPWYVSSMSDESPACLRPTDSAESSALGVSASPADLLAELENAGNVSYAGRTGTGRHKVDTYRFTYRFTHRYHIDHRTFEKRGTVDIDVATRRIIHVAYDQTDVTGDGKRMLAASGDLTFSDFGAPVTVVRPAHAVPR